jgi:glycosyltransferase involved in cell wall biosynthesis
MTAMPMSFNPAAVPSSAGPRPKICFVAEQFVPPVYDGSTRVYKMWIDLLATSYDLYAVFFQSEGGDDSREAEQYLRTICKAHLILPGLPRHKAWKVARAIARYATGTLFAPRLIEAYGRGGIERDIADFVDEHDLRLFVFSKIHALNLFGRKALRHLSDATVFIDLHDDFVAREELDRRVLRDLFDRFPALRHYRPYAHTMLRHRLSRLVATRARRQEAILLRRADCLLSSSREECRSYRQMLDPAVPCEFLQWPVPREGMPQRPPPAGPEFEAGFLGGDNPFNLEAVVHFCTQILPLIRARHPRFRVLIAGKVTTPLALIAPSWPGVHFEKFVDDVADFYARVAVVVVPLLSGTGVSIKTLEAIEYRKPVVASRVGVRGLPLHLPSSVVVADQPAEFALGIEKFLGARDSAGPATAARPPADQATFLREFSLIAQRYRRGRETGPEQRDRRRGHGAP